MADDASQTPPAFDGEEANALLPVPARRLLRSGAVDGAAEGARSLAAPGLVLVCDLSGFSRMGAETVARSERGAEALQAVIDGVFARIGAIIARMTRSSMLEVLGQDYVRTAKAKGVDGGSIVMRHVFRNSLLPIITMFVTVFPATLAGSVVIERIFSIPGMGSMIIDAIFLRDTEILLSNSLIIGIVNVVALLLADILYAMADPRITYK